VRDPSASKLAAAEAWLESTASMLNSSGAANCTPSRNDKNGAGATAELREFIDQSIRARAESQETEIKASSAVSKVDSEERAKTKKILAMVKTKDLFLGSMPAATFFASTEIERISGTAAPYVVAGLILISVIASWMYLVSERCFGEGTTTRAVRGEMGAGMSAFAGIALAWDYLLLAAIYLGSAKAYLEADLGLESLFHFQPTGSVENMLRRITFAVISCIVIILWIAVRRTSAHRSFWLNAFALILALWAGWAAYTEYVKGLYFPRIETRIFRSDRIESWMVRNAATSSILILFSPFAASLFLLVDENELRRNRISKPPSHVATARWQVIRDIFVRAVFPAFAALSITSLVPSYERARIYSGIPMLGGALFMLGPTPLRTVFSCLVGCAGVVSLTVAFVLTTKSAIQALREALEAIGLESQLKPKDSEQWRRFIVWSSLFTFEVGFTLFRARRH
jgi:hypothetical protein